MISAVLLVVSRLNLQISANREKNIDKMAQGFLVVIQIYLIKKDFDLVVKFVRRIALVWARFLKSRTGHAATM